KNCATTVVKVLQVVDEGLARFFPDHDTLIVVSDGFSTDGTREVAGATATRLEKLVLEQRGGPGKGVGVRTILEEARARGARAIALVDGDLTSIQPQWLKLLLGPVLAGADLVVPLYLRHPHDGVITNHVVYPLVNVLFGLGVRQPIGGEFALSGFLAEKLLSSPLFPEKFGIDIFITVTGAVHGGKVVEAALGVKEHESTKQYSDPEALLVPMFHQVTGTLFSLIHHFRDHVRSVEGSKEVEQVGSLPAVVPAPVPVNEEMLFARFRKLVRTRISGRDTFLGRELAAGVERLAGLPLEEFGVPLPLWVKGLYRALLAHRDSPDEALRVLEPLWQGRYLSFVRETRDLPVEEAEARIRAQLTEFRRQADLVREAL
ncbi:TPA: glycosyltransferase, partial [Candidatus Bipolaricaulota bacterium]|nr:glycosyltransferase [Candidatus Bipolaricaulota bacterium]